MTSLLGAFFAQLVIVTYRHYSAGTPSPLFLPLPSEYTSPIVVYGALGLIAGTSPEAARFAGIAGWGFVVATLLNLWDPTTGKAKPAGTGPATYQKAVPGAATQNAGTQPVAPGNVVFAPRSFQ